MKGFFQCWKSLPKNKKVALIILFAIAFGPLFGLAFFTSNIEFILFFCGLMSGSGFFVLVLFILDTLGLLDD